MAKKKTAKKKTAKKKTPRKRRKKAANTAPPTLTCELPVELRLPSGSLHVSAEGIRLRKYNGKQWSRTLTIAQLDAFIEAIAQFKE